MTRILALLFSAMLLGCVTALLVTWLLITKYHKVSPIGTELWALTAEFGKAYRLFKVRSTFGAEYLYVFVEEDLPAFPAEPSPPAETPHWSIYAEGLPPVPSSLGLQVSEEIGYGWPRIWASHVIGGSMNPLGPTATVAGYEVPLRFHVPSFLFNAAMFGVPCFIILIAGFFAIRGVRRLRGRCPRCRYDLRGAAPSEDARFAGCPECGWGRSGPRE